MLIQHLDDVEQKIDRLLGDYSNLKKENIELIEEIERLEQALQEKSEAVMQYTQERESVRSRIDGLLARLEDRSAETLNEKM